MTPPGTDNSLLITLAILAFSASLSALLSLYLLERRSGSKSALWMALLMAACAWWSSINAFEYIAAGLQAKLILAGLQYLSIASMPAIWFAFCSSLFKEEGSINAREPSFIIWIIPVITACLVWFDPFLGLVRNYPRLRERPPFATVVQDFGPWF